jgi:hypothetical protein
VSLGRAGTVVWSLNQLDQGELWPRPESYRQLRDSKTIRNDQNGRADGMPASEEIRIAARSLFAKQPA